MNQQSFIKKIFHYSQRIQTLGIKKSCKIAFQKINKKYKDYYLRKRAFSKNNLTWKEICKNHNHYIFFEDFWKTLYKNDFLSSLEQEELFQKYLPTKFHTRSLIIAEADLICTNTFTILGCTKTFEDGIRWHTDIKNNYTYDATQFYKDIHPTLREAHSYDDYFTDIKIPWELSRMNHLYVLGKAYEYTQNEKYALYFQDHISDWINNNPFLLGPNWVCPMDVGLRALNIIWGCHFFRHSSSIQLPFWEMVSCSLYDHATYLQDNWENFPPTSNHYLSDLIGYFYLCFFFEQFSFFKEQKEWCFQELLQEHEIQIHDDGTSYEGSSHYHGLITELYLHFFCLSQIHALSLPQKFITKFQRIFAFIDDIANQSGAMTYIGDMDGGKILTGLKPQSIFSKSLSVAQYKNFGVTIIRSNSFHGTFRNIAYERKQPSGHFHEDDLSITFSWNGIPILVDPGTYLYTANSQWRNYFRSNKNHSTVYRDSSKTFHTSLFQLPLSERQDTPTISCDNHTLTIAHSSPFNDGVLKRSLTVNDEKVTIEDSQENRKNKSQKLHWNFIFHPYITVTPISKNQWSLIHHSKVIGSFFTPFPLTQENSFFSPTYGIIQKCLKLQGTNILEPFSSMIFYFEKINGC